MMQQAPLLLAETEEQRIRMEEGRARQARHLGRTGR